MFQRSYYLNLLLLQCQCTVNCTFSEFLLFHSSVQLALPNLLHCKCHICFIILRCTYVAKLTYACYSFVQFL